MATFSTLRKNAGYATQDALAAKLGLKNRFVVAKWETGACFPRTEMIPKVATALKTTEGEIIKSIEASREAHNQSA